MSHGSKRSDFLRATGATLLAVAFAPGAALATARRAPAALLLSTRNIGRHYAGDRNLFATVAPGVPGRDRAAVRFSLSRPAQVKLEAVRTALRKSTVAWETTATLRPGAHELTWAPELETPVGSYVMRLTIDRPGALTTVLGSRRPASVAVQQAPVVRVLGIEASFEQRSYLPGERMGLRVLADAPRFTITFLRCGWEPQPTVRNDEMTGLPMGAPAPIDWTGKRSGPVRIEVQTGDWPTGLYVARLEAEDGRVGFAPFILRAAQPSPSRAAVVLPTNTWQAYNMYDADGDGWGDTWYAGGNPAVVLDRPFADRGVPPRYRRYDLPFLLWLRRMRHTPDFLAEDDLETFATGDDLRRLYDLIAFPGHTEYVTEHEYDVIERFRDLGGRLVFLSANNFFWRIDREGKAIRRIRRWRDLGRPEASLVGSQYRANDDGTRRGVYYVTEAEAAPWLFTQTGLASGSKLGEVSGGYGIEIDATSAASPPGTAVLAVVPALYGPGYNAEMTYYETPAGSRVFAAGTLDFGATAMIGPTWKLLDNLWRHMLQDVPPPPPT